MFRIVLTFIFLIFLVNCSVDNKSGIWKDKKQLKVTTNISNLDFGYDTTFKQFKDNVIQYGKLGNHQKLDK